MVDTFDYLNLKNVNKLVLDNLEIIKKEEYYLKIRLIDIFKKIREEIV